MPDTAGLSLLGGYPLSTAAIAYVLCCRGRSGAFAAAIDARIRCVTMAAAGKSQSAQYRHFRVGASEVCLPAASGGGNRTCTHWSMTPPCVLLVLGIGENMVTGSVISTTLTVSEQMQGVTRVGRSRAG
ncbi:MAG: hypothetical protein JWM45_1215 [Pseudonocardiales bacterium]|nr:hypothetical protein [Pseudonocardiales bacterium]